MLDSGPLVRSIETADDDKLAANRAADCPDVGAFARSERRRGAAFPPIGAQSRAKHAGCQWWALQRGGGDPACGQLIVTIKTQEKKNTKKDY